MGILGVIGRIAGATVIEKVEDELTKKQNREQTSKYCIYIKNNMEHVCKIVKELEDETKTLVEQVESMEGIRISFRARSEFRQTKGKAIECLKYLYLSKDFFTCLSKNTSGVALKNDELMLVTKFAPFFDGVPVLKYDDEKKDDSLLGEFNEIRDEIRVAFLGKKSSTHFDFDEYLNRYEEKIEKYRIPDVMAAIKSFENAIAALNDPVPATATVEPVAVDTSATVATVTDGVECTNCHAKLGTSAKFCPKCGTKIETKKPSFCVECGASLAAGTNFCPECGTKV